MAKPESKLLSIVLALTGSLMIDLSSFYAMVMEQTSPVPLAIALLTTGCSVVGTSSSAQHAVFLSFLMAPHSNTLAGPIERGAYLGACLASNGEPQLE